MSKNMIQFQPGMSLAAFLKRYGTEEQCREALYEWRWPKGYECPRCGHHSACKLKHRQLYQCNRCHHQSSVIAGTIFQDTKLPLSIWFLGIYFLTQSNSQGSGQRPCRPGKRPAARRPVRRESGQLGRRAPSPGTGDPSPTLPRDGRAAG